MTLKEKVAMIQPDSISEQCFGGVTLCPNRYSFLPNNMNLCTGESHNMPSHEQCTRCWNQEIPNAEPNPYTPAAEASMKVIEAFMTAGFTRDEAFTILLGQIKLNNIEPQRDVRSREFAKRCREIHDDWCRQAEMCERGIENDT